jgi:hypothetical protein
LIGSALGADRLAPGQIIEFAFALVTYVLFPEFLLGHCIPL